jgi:hypothetical protein
MLRASSNQPIERKTKPPLIGSSVGPHAPALSQSKRAENPSHQRTTHQETRRCLDIESSRHLSRRCIQCM